ncbi:MAG: thermonuclease family protein [Candidatus Thiodiazotropha sp.]|nr:thermonuclease family protein [Candidatus Thiodiazotropha taylori]MBT3057905.1 thermonuclease family protein [Candidatus Thiodiazotropha sp. (ex Lucina pensylvanica)]MBV2095035.1 thermonuclease family protein [Candidatus Thiodiazotropha sp. (ex Codakia orbicularis)]PUB77872.1 MAG: dihydrolipoamide succinyltransferase [gamma proteobacterium symbiont of Ctena orbiculata]MBT3064672.1 thermonuclease family protein [Candidatus Thiodiazotropha sp. (ex Lucina pensylvanica)]
MIRLLPLLLLILLILDNSAHAAVLQGQVVAVHSGDRITLKLADGTSKAIKLSGIRIPSVGKGMDRIATRHLGMLLAGRFVRVEYTSLSSSGVILGRVLHGGADIALRMLSDGLAVTEQDPRQQPSSLRRYREAEATARSRGLGFWQKLR